MSLRENFLNTSKTFVETAGVYLLARGIGVALDKIGVPHGNVALVKDSMLSKIWKEDPKLRRKIGLVVAPLVEEIDSRAIPLFSINVANKLLGFRDRSLEGMLALITCAQFALAHNYWRDESDKVHFDTSVPIETFLFAQHAWRVSEKRNLMHGIFAHMIFNLFAEIETSREESKKGGSPFRA